MHTTLRLIALTLAARAAFAQNPAPAPAPTPPTQAPTATATIPAKWDVSAKRAASKDVEFDVNNGTWINLDVSPDGKTIVFDLLGDLYTIPMAGGQATLLLG